MVVPVIKLQSVDKVFLTDEVETHALSDVNLDVAKGEYVLLSILGLFDRRVVEPPLEMAAS
jgi:hypothetical protein